MSCPHNDLIHIHHAYLAVARGVADCLQQPIGDEHDRCVIGDVTADVRAACATFTNCRLSAAGFERISRHYNNCTGQTTDWSQLQRQIYLHVHYDCLPAGTCFRHSHTSLILS